MLVKNLRHQWQGDLHWYRLVKGWLHTSQINQIIITTKTVITDDAILNVRSYRSSELGSILAEFSWTVCDRRLVTCIAAMNDANVQINVTKLNHKQHTNVASLQHSGRQIFCQIHSSTHSKTQLFQQ